MLLNWLQDVCWQVGFQRQTYYLAQVYCDMALTRTRQSLQELQLLGITALYISMKNEEVELKSCGKFSEYTMGAFTPNQIALKER